MELKFKRLPGGEGLPLPQYKTDHAAGLDLPAAVQRDTVIPAGKFKLIPTGFSVEIPVGYEGQVRPRSGLAVKHGIGILNAPGTIDADYRGEIGVILFNFSDRDFTISRGDRIAQLVITRMEHVSSREVEHLNDSRRGEGGFGHTGR
mgnify:CR=1